MIKRNASMETEIRKRMREGSGEVEIQHIFKKEELKGKARLVARITLKQGCSIGSHAHGQEEEIFYVIKGEGVATENGETFILKEGDAMLTGGGSSHAIVNQSKNPLELFAVILLF
jgi:quercetin dioxygenase-like cupin family protein